MKTIYLSALVAVLAGFLFIPVQTSAYNCPNIGRTLLLGSQGADVMELQAFLKETGDFSYPTSTGYFGVITQKAVQDFQSENGIVSSGTPFSTGYGIVGPKTRAALQVNCSMGIEEQNQSMKDISEITFKSTAGECVGWCYRSITLTPKEAQFSARYSSLTDSEYKPENYLKTYPVTNEWERVTEVLEIPFLTSLPTKIGCPDCSDSGAGTIEIVLRDGRTKSITYDNYEVKSEAPELLPLIKMLESIMEPRSDVLYLAEQAFEISERIDTYIEWLDDGQIDEVEDRLDYTASEIEKFLRERRRLYPDENLKEYFDDLEMYANALKSGELEKDELIDIFETLDAFFAFTDERILAGTLVDPLQIINPVEGEKYLPGKEMIIQWEYNPEVFNGSENISITLEETEIREEHRDDEDTVVIVDLIAESVPLSQKNYSWTIPKNYNQGEALIVLECVNAQVRECVAFSSVFEIRD